MANMSRVITVSRDGEGDDGDEEQRRVFWGSKQSRTSDPSCVTLADI